MRPPVTPSEEFATVRPGLLRDPFTANAQPDRSGQIVHTNARRTDCTFGGLVACGSAMRQRRSEAVSLPAEKRAARRLAVVNCAWATTILTLFQ